MLRTLFSVITVVLFVVMSWLLYRNYLVDSRIVNTAPGGPSTSAPPAPPPQVAPPPAAPKPVAAPRPPEIIPVVAQPVAAPELPVPPPPVKPPELKRTHTVQAGDSLWAISRRYYGNPDLYNKIAEANGMAGKTLLRRGQVIVLPALPNHPFNEESIAASPATLSIEQTADHESPTPAPVAETPAPVEPDTTVTESPNFEPQPPTLSVKRRKPVILDE